MFDLPESFVIEGEEYPINTDWKIWAEIGQIFSEDRSAESLGKVFCLCFKGDKLPPFAAATEEMSKFYKRGKEAAERKTKDKPVFDLVYDFGLISAAFFSQYGINLRCYKLHWWEFWELFEGLKSDEKIIKVIGWRSCDLREIKNKEERKYIKKMKELYSLPRRNMSVTAEEIGFEIGKLF